MFLRILILLGGVLLGISAPAAYAESSWDGLVQAQAETLDLSEIEGFMEEIDREVGAYFPSLNFSQLLAKIRAGEFEFDFGNFLEGILRYFLGELGANTGLLGELIILAVLAAVLQQLQVAFSRPAVTQVASLVILLALISLSLNSFRVALASGGKAIEQMVGFIQAVLPVLTVLMTAVGGATTAALLHPLIITAVGILGTLIKDLIFPLVYLAAILGVINQITTRVQVSRLAEFFRNLSIISLGLFLTIFTAVLGLQGVTTSVASGVTFRSAKFLTGAFVPIIGKTLADALDSVLAASLLLKTAVGVAGLIGILALTAFPALKILGLVLIYRIAAALIQPFGETPLIGALQEMGNALTVVFATVAAVGLMFLITLTLIVGFGNLTVLLR